MTTVFSKVQDGGSRQLGFWLLCYLLTYYERSTSDLQHVHQQLIGDNWSNRNWSQFFWQQPLS
jgi:hypothetical protein